MNTFVPHTDFRKIPQLIVTLGGAKRLHKQVAECGQILRVIDKIYHNVPSGWQGHPAVKMWVGYDSALFAYMLELDNYRRFKLGSFRHKEISRCLNAFAEYDEDMTQVYVQLPPWWGGPIHNSHYAVLEAKGLHLPHKHLYYWPELNGDVR